MSEITTTATNTLTVYKNNEFGELEILWENEKAYFPAIQCAEILGYSNPRDAIYRHCKIDGVVKHDVVSSTTNQYGITTFQNVTKKFITEGNLYRLIVRSKLEAAQRFESWVFDEVLPSIRKTGSYGISNNAELSAEITSLITQITTLKAQLEATQKLALFAARSVPQPPDYRIQYNSIAPIITKLQHLLGKSSHKEVLSYIYDTMEEHGGFNRKFAMNRLKSRYPTYYVDDKQPSIIDSIIEFPDYYEQFMKTLARVEKKLTTVVSEQIPTLSPEDQIHSIIAPLIAKRNDHSMNGIRTYGLVYKAMGSKASWSQLMRRCGVKTKKEVLLARPDKYDLFCRCVQQLMAD